MVLLFRMSCYLLLLLSFFLSIFIHSANKVNILLVWKEYFFCDIFMFLMNYLNSIRTFSQMSSVNVKLFSLHGFKPFLFVTVKTFRYDAYRLFGNHTCFSSHHSDGPKGPGLVSIVRVSLWYTEPMPMSPRPSAKVKVIWKISLICMSLLYNSSTPSWESALS